MSFLKAVGYLALSVAFGANGIEALRGGSSPTIGAPPNPPGRKRRPFGGLGRAPSGKPGDANSRKVNVGGIDSRVAQIRKLLVKGSTTAEVAELASSIVSQKCRRADGSKTWCVPEKDSLAETQALFKAVRDPNSETAIRYTGDPMLADSFTSAKRTLKRKHSGDCDDYAISLGAMLMAINHPVKLRVIQTKDKPSWCHIYLLTPKDHNKPQGEWIAVDASMNKPLGWEAPGASEVARTGKPAGITVRVRDFPVEKE